MKLRNSHHVPPGSAQQTGAEVFCHGLVASGGWLGGMLSLSCVRAAIVCVCVCVAVFKEKSECT